jgi:UDP-glucose 4-epimerase
LNFAIQFLEKISGLSLNRKTEEKRCGDQIDTSGINKFACEKLGWQSKVGIREGLERQLKESY